MVGGGTVETGTIRLCEGSGEAVGVGRGRGQGINCSVFG